MPEIPKKGCNFTLRWLLDLWDTFLEQNLRLKTYITWVICSLSLLFFICCLADPWLTFGYFWRNNLSHLMLITAFGLSIFVQKVTWRGWASTPNWVSSGFWSQWHTPFSHTPQIAENTLPRLALRFSKMWKCPQYPKQL